MLSHATWDGMAQFWLSAFCIIVLLGAIKDR